MKKPIGVVLKIGEYRLLAAALSDTVYSGWVFDNRRVYNTRQTIIFRPSDSWLTNLPRPLSAHLEDVRQGLSSAMRRGPVDGSLIETREQLSNAINSMPWNFLRRGVRLAPLSAEDNFLWLLVDNDIPASLLRVAHHNQLMAAADLEHEMRFTPLRVVEGGWDVVSSRLAERYLSARMYVLVRKLGYMLRYKTSKNPKTPRGQGGKPDDGWADNLINAISSWGRGS